MSPAESRSPFVIIKCVLLDVPYDHLEKGQSQCGHLWFISVNTRPGCDSRACCVHKREEEEMYETAYVCVYLMDNSGHSGSLCGCSWKSLFSWPHLHCIDFHNDKRTNLYGTPYTASGWSLTEFIITESLIFYVFLFMCFTRNMFIHLYLILENEEALLKETFYGSDFL